MRRDPRNRRGESGQVLIYVTLALVLALLIIPPLLGFVFTGGRSAQIREDRMLQVHAADAGIEDGYCFVVANATALPGSPEDPPTEIDMGTINGYDVNVQIFKDVTTEGVYKLLSTATSDGGRELRIESYTSQWDYSALMANALTSRDMIDVQPGITITGNVSANDLDKQSENNILKGMDGELHLGDTPGWPEADELADFYYGDVEGYPPYSSDTLDINTLDPLGDPLYREIADPLYREGDLYMISGNHSDVLTLTLGGTVYVTGDLLIGKTAHPFTLDLAGQTIFCEQSIRVGGSCNLVGPGCIIAVDWVEFMPNFQSSDFIFVMAVGDDDIEGSGKVTLQPGSQFHGSVAARDIITLQPNVDIMWEYYDPELLNFPPGSELPRVVSYVILD